MSRFGRTAPLRPPYVLIVAVAAVLLVGTGATIALGAWEASLACTPEGPTESTPPSHPCPLPPPPSPTTFLAANTTFTVEPGQFDYFQFVTSYASITNLTGWFTASQEVAILVMTPPEFSNYSAPPSHFQCVQSECFTTGNVTAGELQAYLLLYATSIYGLPVGDPWYLVMQNLNDAEVAEITWTSNLVATYEVVYI